jgi:hypothetical protein
MIHEHSDCFYGQILDNPQEDSRVIKSVSKSPCQACQSTFEALTNMMMLQVRHTTADFLVGNALRQLSS